MISFISHLKVSIILSTLFGSLGEELVNLTERLGPFSRRTRTTTEKGADDRSLREGEGHDDDDRKDEDTVQYTAASSLLVF